MLKFPKVLTQDDLRGLPGRDGIDGKDGADGQDGIDGEDYILTEQDKEEIASMVEVPVVEKVVETIVEKVTEVVIKEQPIIKTEIVKETTKEIVFDETPESIVDKINSLDTEPENQIDAKHIKNLPTGNTILKGGYSAKRENLNDISNNSSDAGSSTYTMSSGVPVEFKSSDGNSIMKIDETSESVGFSYSSPEVPVDIAGVTPIFTGSELIINLANRDFSSNTGSWTGTGWSIGSGVATHSSGTTAFTLSNSALSAAPSSGKAYKISFTVNTTVAVSTGGCRAGFTGSTTSIFGYVTGTRTYTITSLASGTAAFRFTPLSGSWQGTIDNVSIKEVFVQDSYINLRDSSDGYPYVTMRANYGGLGIGEDSMKYDDGSGSYGFGFESLSQNTSGAYNISIGSAALKKNSSVGLNVAIGQDSLTELIGGDFGANAAIGFSSLKTVKWGSYNSAYGAYAGTALIDGSNNMFLGYRAGDNLTIGSSNIVIGTDIDTPTTTSSNTLNIGNTLFGTSIDGTGTTISSGSIGVGTNSPDRRFHTEVSDAITNAITYAERLSHITSGTAAIGFGTGIEYELENASGTNIVAATQEFTWSDATNATEDATYKLRLIKNGTLTDAVTVNSVGDTTIAGKVIPGDTVRLKGYTVATLPAGTQGDTCFCTDLLAPTYLGIAVGGGAVVAKVFFDGINWIT
jgi:hypothetical protein